MLVNAVNFARSLHLDGLLTFASYGKGDGREDVTTVERANGGAAFVKFCADRGLGTSLLIAQPTMEVTRTLKPSDIGHSLHVAVHFPDDVHTALASLGDLPEPTALLSAGPDTFAIWRLNAPVAGKDFFELSEGVAARAGGRASYFVPLPGTLRQRNRVREEWFKKHVVYGAEDLSAKQINVKALTRADQIQSRPRDWIWPGMIRAGRMIILLGEPGVGKSQICMDIGARLTTGRDWPDGSPATQIGSVAFFEAEDDEEDTRDRAEVAGADMSRMLIVEEARNLSTPSGIASLERELDRMDNPRLIVLSPYRSYFGGKDDKESKNEVEIRRRLAPLQNLIKERGIAVIAIGHKTPGKSGRSAEDAAGPQAYGRAVRSMMTAVIDQTDPLFKRDPKKAKRALVSAKANNSGDDYKLLYHIVGLRASSGEIAPRIEWLGKQETLALPAPKTTNDWLRQKLSDGPAHAAEIELEASTLGYSRSTLYRAYKDLGVLSGRDGFQGQVTWELP